MAKANHGFLKTLFTTDFPEYAKNPLFITGESYAGIYVPTIVREILADPGPLTLAGFAVGDGCMGTDVLCGSNGTDPGPYYKVEFMHGHGQVGPLFVRVHTPSFHLHSTSPWCTSSHTHTTPPP